jgi:hypothetical protein
MDNYMEVQPILLAYIANVSTSKIKEGRLSVEELQRIRYAGQVIKNSKMWLASVKEFTIEKIKAVVSEYKRNTILMKCILITFLKIPIDCRIC